MGRRSLIERITPRLAAAETANNALRNRAFCVEQATTNVQGFTGGGGIIALATLKAKASGLFVWGVSFDHNAAAADAVSVSTTFETGVGAVVLANAGAVGTGCSVDTAATGTYIGITNGGGVGQYTAHALAETIATAGSGLLYTAGGIAGADAANTPVAVGDNILMALHLVNSAHDETCHAITLSLYELP